MNDLPLDDGVRARMQGIRCDIDQGLEDVSASARSMVDWKHYVKTYPWVCLGTAAALGFLIVPKRAPAIHAGLATPAELAKSGQRVINSAPAAARMGRFARRVPSSAWPFAREPPTWAGAPEDYWEQLALRGQFIMIQIPRPELSNNGPGRSWFGLENGEVVGMARKGASQIVREIERFVARRPAICLGAALSVGIALGWWVKRR